MAITGLSNTTSMIAGIYDDAVFAFKELNLMRNLVTTFGAAGYKVRTVPTWSTATARTVADGEDYVTNDLFSKSAKATFTPQEVMAQFILTDQMVQTDPDGATAAAARELGGAVAEKMDKDLTAVFSTFTNGKGSTNSALTIALCAAALAIVRSEGGRSQAYFVLHPFQYHDIWTELGKPTATITPAPEMANEALRQYMVGTFLGAQWFTTNNVVPDSGDDAYGAVFTRDALGLDIREGIELRPQRDESLRATELNMHTGYGVGKLWGERGAYLLSDASEPS